MFKKAKKLSIQDTAFHIVGSDMTIVNNYYTYREPKVVLARFFICHKWSNKMIFHTIIAANHATHLQTPPVEQKDPHDWKAYR